MVYLNWKIYVIVIANAAILVDLFVDHSILELKELEVNNLNIIQIFKLYV